MATTGQELNTVPNRARQLPPFIVASKECIADPFGPLNPKGRINLSVAENEMLHQEIKEALRRVVDSQGSALDIDLGYNTVFGIPLPELMKELQTYLQKHVFSSYKDVKTTSIIPTAGAGTLFSSACFKSLYRQTLIRLC